MPYNVTIANGGQCFTVEAGESILAATKHQKTI